MLIIDDYAKLTQVGFLNEKYEALGKIKTFKYLVENLTDFKINFLRYDRGGEFTSNEFDYFCEEHVIRIQFLIASTSQQNDVVERHNIMVQQMDRMMLDEKILPNTFWVEVVHSTIHILSKYHFKSNNEKIPYELWYGKLASINHFKVFESKCYIKINVGNLGNFDLRANEGIFLGY